jgi:NAD(P)-dependent dehydrogenase (short-subunit alcohol dehydrogenase family)
MRGKVCLVTGATAGIGVVTARALAERGATVVVVGRNREKCVTTVGQIRQTTGNDAVEFLLVDLSRQCEVRQLAQAFLDRYPRLDVLVNNAGALFASHQLTAEGFEQTFAVNHLGPFLLTNLLLDVLKASAPARIVTVASGSHERARIDFANLQGPPGLFGMTAYGQSKLANVLFTYELARRLAGTGVTANALHPGFVASSFASNNGVAFALGMRLARLFAISPEQGAQTSVYLATSPEVEGVTCKYYVKCKPVHSSPASYDEAAARRLWQVSAEMTGLSEAVA